MLIWILAVAVGFGVTDAGQRKTGEVVYNLNFLSSLENCDGTDNQVLDMSGLELQHDSETVSSLTGEIVIKSAIEEGTEVIVTVYKNDGDGLEFFYMVQGDLCNHLGDSDMPWSTLFQVMEVSNCPIQAKTYPVERLALNLDYAKPVMKHEFVGEYRSTMEIRRVGGGLDPVPKVLSCHRMDTSVVETKAEDGAEK